MNRLKITQDSIQNELSGYRNKPYDSIAEYIWNSFDAGAKTVTVDYENSDFGYVKNLIIKDNGVGWDFNDNSTDYFMASAKKDANIKNLSLPHGKLGRGRYTFIWHAAGVCAKSGGQKLTLLPNAEYKIEDCDDAPEKGTTVEIQDIREVLSDALRNEESLRTFIAKEFCWFLEQNIERSIIINGAKLDYSGLIHETVEFTKKDFSDEIQKAIGDIKINVVIWNERPLEYAKFFVINSDSKKEVIAEHTGLNKKKDNFWHSVYLYSEKFTEDLNVLINKDESPQVSMFDNNEVVSIYKLLKDELKEKLLEIRKPILDKNAESLVMNLKTEGLFPDLLEFHVAEEDFSNLLKQVYVTAPHLFTGKSKDDQRFVTTSIAGLVSSGNRSLVMKVLSQVVELSDEESRRLEDILDRTHLSNVVNTIAEVDSRLQALHDIKSLLFDYEKETLEVKHLQKALDNNLWLFGENYSLFASTEGAMNKVLRRYAKEKLDINPEEIETKSRKEVDLFLTRANEVSENRHENLVIEIKRPSITLGKKELDQIQNYATTIAGESALNGDKMHWEYYLVGNNYDDYIEGFIDNASNHGEKHKGLVFYSQKQRFKIYVKKWSDIIYVENTHRLKYLKEALNIKPKDVYDISPDKLTERLMMHKLDMPEVTNQKANNIDGERSEND